MCGPGLESAQGGWLPRRALGVGGCGPELGSAQGGWLPWRTLGVGDADTKVENPSHRLRQTTATTTVHVMDNCFCLGIVLIPE